CVVPIELLTYQGSHLNQLAHQSQFLWYQRADEQVYPSCVAAGPAQTGDKSHLDRIRTTAEDDRNRYGRRHRGSRCCIASSRGDHRHLPLDQIGGQRRQPVIAALRPAILDRDVLALDVATFLQPHPKCGRQMRGWPGRWAAEIPDHRHRRLRRTRRERPRRRTADERDELATAAHSITSSARPDSGRGTVRRSVLAVFRLMISSIFVTC